MKQLSSLQKRVEQVENALNKGREPQDPVDRFWATMRGREGELYRRITNLWPFEEAAMRLWNAALKDGQEGVNRVWESLNPTQRMLWEANTALHEHIERRMVESDLTEFDPTTWPEEVQKLVLEEVER